MEQTQVCFYEDANYSGKEHYYNENDDVTFTYPEYLNDRFKSVKVGALVKVLAWQHSDGGGKHEVWEKDCPDISAIGGLSKFKIIANSTQAVAVRFENNVGTGRYCLYVKAAGVSDGMVKSCADDREFKLIGIMPAGGPAVTTAVYVRDEKTGEYLDPVGSLHLRWNDETKQVDVADSTNFPSYLKWERATGNRFVISLEKIPSLA
ncbi:beta/gamma crystallin domain-containing protein [Nonomuraea sp. NPDC000554]|uniref:beta/gamma crystallin domain-containing protein n=1 Tax=Nonomuraea sp. NPDC000554 TaxID=3154259 RepID=UPI003323EEA8